MIKLLTNRDISTSHHKIIQGLLANAVEVYIAVAFLKKNGLNMLLPFFDKPIKFKILAGYNFGISDPDALTTLYDYTEKSNRIAAYLVNLKLKQVFHPKMYLIKDQHHCHIIIGSANLTNGGLAANNESSIYHQCSDSDPIWRETLAYFDECIDIARADVLSKRIISIYRKWQKKQKVINIQSEEFPDMSANLIYDLTKLKAHYHALDKKEILAGFKLKEEHYQQAKEVLDEIINKTHTPIQFKTLVEDLVGRSGEHGLWYSNGMFRHKTSIFDQQSQFKKLIKSIKDNLDKSPEHIYKTALQIASGIKGVGPNFIGEIMMTYAPNKLANINQNPITVLRKEGGADIKAYSSSFDEENYEEYNAIIKEIADKLGLKNMLEMDYFFNTIYQKIKNNSK